MATYAVLADLSICCPAQRGRLSTCYSPVRRCTRPPKETFSLDLHVLSPPLTFALSQDQTLHLRLFDRDLVATALTSSVDWSAVTIAFNLLLGCCLLLSLRIATHGSELGTERFSISSSLFGFQRPTRTKGRYGGSSRQRASLTSSALYQTGSIPELSSTGTESQAGSANVSALRERSIPIPRS